MGGKYTVKRILLLIPTIFLVCLIVFALMRCVPGDAVDAIVTRMTQAGQPVDAEAVRAKLGMDKPASCSVLLCGWARFCGAIWATPLPVPLSGAIFWLLRSGVAGTGHHQSGAVQSDLHSHRPVLRGKAGLISDYTIRIIAVILMSILMFWLATLVLFYPAQWWSYAADGLRQLL